VKLSDRSSYEVSIERMTGANFLRTEYRFEPIQDSEIFIEWIKRVGNLDDKFVLGLDTAFTFFETPFEMESYYSYVSEGLGMRAVLTEDFISTGHGVSMEIKTPLLASGHFNKFFRFDGYKGNSRFILGIELKI
jgi:hypothetical protein